MCAESLPRLCGARFAVLLLEGGAGIGKTTVWREVMTSNGLRHGWSPQI
jgi:predicted ATPase